MFRCKRPRKPGEYAVTYDSASHFSVLFQGYGSVWDEVLPYCIFNVGLMILDYLIFDDFFRGRGILITDKGHNASIFFVSFLVVSRANMALSRYNEARNNLETMAAKSRDMMAGIIAQTKDVKTEDAREWRKKVAHYLCLTLRLATAAWDYHEDKKEPWTLKEVPAELKEKLVGPKSFSHCSRTPVEESFRTPHRMALQLRFALHVFPEEDTSFMGDPLKNRFNGHIDAIMDAYSAQCKMLRTPMPFPLVQMARTMMLAWVFTLPFALQSDKSTLVAHCLVVFLLTFAFMGLETVSLELDNPFGKDDNDLDDLGITYSTLEEIYEIVGELDGEESASSLYRSMGGGPTSKFVDEKTGLLCC